MKNKALFITMGILILIGSVVTWFILSRKTSPPDASDPGSDPAKPQSSTDLSRNEKLMPLQKGSGFGNAQQAQLVSDLQTGLNKNFQANIAIDGDFGSQTQSALQSRGLPVVIYWKEWSYITRKPIYVAGQKVTVTSL